MIVSTFFLLVKNHLQAKFVAWNDCLLLKLYDFIWKKNKFMKHYQ